jgi:hypothetical protein
MVSEYARHWNHYSCYTGPRWASQKTENTENLTKCGR